ncbi:motility associated factor glycosyltransferase family protein [Oceanobacillus massiliensis]|uniref:motility associated factor glycosyltransferase family protein n=1 Tax=Oceanobacillus massiliensis TaxID=1465765 RepID=UPI003018EE7C
MKISIFETRTVPTIKIENQQNNLIFHSKYDPMREVNAWCKNALEEIKPLEEIVIIGLAAGYHVIQLAEALPGKNITVIEFNEIFYKWFKKSPFSVKIKEMNNVKVKHFGNISKEQRLNIFSTIPSTNLLIHKNGLDIMPTEYMQVKGILEDIQFQKKSINNQIENMKSNFFKNVALNDNGIGNLKNKYLGKPMILISAGPSLDKQLDLLKKIHYENKIILGAVGTAIKPLIKNNIIPDFFSIIDPNPETLNQLKDTYLPETTLFYLSTAYHETIMLHKGPRKIMWQKGFEDAEKLAVKLGDPMIQTGGSVATALLDLMVYLGAGKLALVGQDLAFTDNLSHAQHTHAQRNIGEVNFGYKTINYHRNGYVTTAKNLTIYRKWFEYYALVHTNLELYNCTEGGAYINNWKHVKLDQFYKKVIQ